MELQHVNVKLLLREPQALALASVVPVFHRWIHDQVCDGLLLDVADYHHVHHGPGVLVIGHEGDYSIDHSDGRLGVRYNRRAPLAGDNQGRLKQAATAALKACQLLESEPALKGKIRFNGQDVRISVNDRLLAPNTTASEQAVLPEIRSFAERVFRGTHYEISFPEEARRLLTIAIRASRPFSAAEMLENLDCC